jgi:uncharacterized protein (DUF934 family)
MKVIKNGQIAENQWHHLTDDAEIPAGAAVTVSRTRFDSLSDSEINSAGSLGVRIGPAEEIDSLQKQLSKISLIVLEMNPFTDGRSFSQARNLREQLGYRGEIRVTGDFLRDQMFYLHRLGVDSFEFAEGTSLEDRLKAFSEFSVLYQAAQDEPLPLYRRRKV